MKPKALVTAVLLLFVAASVVALVVKNGAPSSEPAAVPAPAEVATVTADSSAATNADVPVDDEKVVVTYFHGNARCATCMKIQMLSGSVVQREFASLIDDKSLEWRTVNTDKPENEHFVEDYQLTTKSVVLSRVRGGKEVEWKNLDRVWELIRDDAAYEAYVRREVEQFVTGEKAAGS